MARVFTSSIPTDTLFDLQTVTSESTFRSRARVAVLTTITEREIDLDADGDLVTVTNEVVSTVLSTSTSTGTRTLTVTSSVPVRTLYSLSLSTSTVEEDDDETTTSASLSPGRQPLVPPLTSSSEDDVVVVTQFTTITPTQATTSFSSALPPRLSSGTSRNPVFPNGASSSTRVSASPANADAASSSSSSGSSLSTGAIAGIAVGAVAVAILLGILGFLFCCRRRRNNKRDSMYATTEGRSDEKLAPTLFNPDYSQSSPQATRTRSSGGNSRRQLLMANVGGAGASALSAGAAGVGAGKAGIRFSSGGREERNTQQYGKNKPVPAVPPPVSSLQYMRPGPGQRGLSDESATGYSHQSSRVHPANHPAAVAAGMMGRPSSASPALATQGGRTVPGKRTSAPIDSTSTPVQTAQERSNALKRAKSVASVKSIPPENLGKGAGYASPMPPIDPLGKPIDQKTWRERNSKIHSGEFWTPDTMLTPEQRLRRDSQLAKLQAARDGTASSKPNLSKLKEEKDEPAVVETSPLLGGDNSFDAEHNSFSSPERASAIYPLQSQTSRVPQPSTSKRPDSTATILPYTDSTVVNTSYRPPSGPLPAIPPPPAPRSPPPSNTIYPSLPPNSPSRSAALSQSSSAVSSPPRQPRYELHQPLAQSYNPVRASFVSAPHQSHTVSGGGGGPPPAPSSQAFNNRLPAIPASRPSSMITSNTTLPEYKRSSNASFTGNNSQTPYAAAAAATTQGTPFFQHHNESSASFGTSRSSHAQHASTSLADNIYGGLTKGLSERDLFRLSQPLQSQGKK